MTRLLAGRSNLGHSAQPYEKPAHPGVQMAARVVSFGLEPLTGQRLHASFWSTRTTVYRVTCKQHGMSLALFVPTQELLG